MGRTTIGIGFGAWSPPSAAPASLYPLAVSADARSLKYADGSRYPVNGDTAWSGVAGLSTADMTTYLEDCAARGVNAVLVNLLEHQFTAHSPASDDADGNPPFGSTVDGSHLDFTDPVEAYWLKADHFISEADRLGIVVWATPAYLGFGQGEEGWGATIQANGTTRMATYGTWLATRYADDGNLVWVLGGDAVPDSGDVGDLSAHYQALAQALRDADATKLLTAHSARGSSSLDSYAFLSDAGLLDINLTYASGGTVASEIETSWGQTPTMPTLLIEAYYGNDNNATTEATVRLQAYQSLLWGGCGHFLGQWPTWYFGVDGDQTVDAQAQVTGTDWHDTLSLYGRQYLAPIAALQAARDLAALTPDHAGAVVTSGGDSASRASSTVLVAYTTGGSLTVDRSQFTAGTYSVRWFNPRDGSTTDDGTATFGSGSQSFSPPDSGDWVLLADLASLALGAP